MDDSIDLSNEKIVSEDFANERSPAIDNLKVDNLKELKSSSIDDVNHIVELCSESKGTSYSDYIHIGAFHILKSMNLTDRYFPCACLGFFPLGEVTKELPFYVSICQGANCSEGPNNAWLEEYNTVTYDSLMKNTAWLNTIHDKYVKDNSNASEVDDVQVEDVHENVVLEFDCSNYYSASGDYGSVESSQPTYFNSSVENVN